MLHCRKVKKVLDGVIWIKRRSWK